MLLPRPYLAGIVDIGVAWYLIPAHGAVGACIGNGAAQAAAVGMMWAVAIHLYKVKLPWMQVAKIAFISALASLTAHAIAVRLAPLWGILCGGSASLIVLFVLFYSCACWSRKTRNGKTGSNTNVKNSADILG
jgi:O-antigen/teichoic acid export membrane protein